MSARRPLADVSGNADADEIDRQQITFPLRNTEQGFLFPLRALIQFPEVEQSASSLAGGQACDGLRYFSKRESEVPLRGQRVALPRNFGGDRSWRANALSNSAPNRRPCIWVKTAGWRGRRDPNASLSRHAFRCEPTINSSKAAFSNIRLGHICIMMMTITWALPHSRRKRGCGLYAFDFGRASFWKWPWVDFPSPGKYASL